MIIFEKKRQIMATDAKVLKRNKSTLFIFTDLKIKKRKRLKSGTSPQACLKTSQGLCFA